MIVIVLNSRTTRDQLVAAINNALLAADRRQEAEQYIANTRTARDAQEAMRHAPDCVRFQVAA